MSHGLIQGIQEFPPRKISRDKCQLKNEQINELLSELFGSLLEQLC